MDFQKKFLFPAFHAVIHSLVNITDKEQLLKRVFIKVAGCSGKYSQGILYGFSLKVLRG
jgi:hypothetical protein